MTIDGYDVGPAQVNVQHTLEQKQTRHVMDDSVTVRVRNDQAAEYYTYDLNRMNDTQKGNMETRFSVAQGSASRVAVVDDESLSYNGYIWNTKLVFRRRVGNFWSTTITVRVST